MVDCLFMGGEERFYALVVKNISEGRVRMQEGYGEDDSECHVGEFVEEELEEGSADLGYREDYPVGKIANVIFFIGALKG